MEKFCNKCNTNKDASMFYQRSDGRLFGSCKDCAKKTSKLFYGENSGNKKRDKTNVRRDHLKYNYGITVEEYDKMYEEQGGLCKICGLEVQHRKLCVDHDHSTNAVRGLLCKQCNIKLGIIESVKKKGLFEKMLDYIR